MSYLNDSSEIKTGLTVITTLCFMCRKDINTESGEEYYVFVNKNSTTGNEPFCVKCYQQDIENMKELDPFITPLYQKNFVRMNKDEDDEQQPQQHQKIKG